MRVFIAIDIDEKTRAVIADVQKQLKAKVDIKKGDLKWVEPENIHLTLKFLGEIDESKLPEIKDITKHTAEAHKNFTLDIESVGSFEGRRGKVIWIGAGKGADELVTLQKDIDGRLEQARYPKEEREFSAHLTICRVRNPRTGFKLVDAAKQFAKFKFGSIDANAICIYQSQLTAEGPIYTQMASFKLV
jgi:2'-5' RNA ligase